MNSNLKIWLMILPENKFGNMNITPAISAKIFFNCRQTFNYKYFRISLLDNSGISRSNGNLSCMLFKDGNY